MNVYSKSAVVWHKHFFTKTKINFLCWVKCHLHTIITLWARLCFMPFRRKFYIALRFVHTIGISHVCTNIDIVIDINAVTSISITWFSCWHGDQFNHDLQDISINAAHIFLMEKKIRICYICHDNLKVNLIFNMEN